MIKTFRGKLKDAEVRLIRLSTNDGLTGYRINKLQIIQENPGNDTVECLVQVFTTENNETGVPRTATTTVNFDDPTLLGVAYYEDAGGSSGSGNPNVVINDVMVFNQDIFVAYKEISGSATDCNFYIECEKVKLSKDEATVATLKDMRAGPDTNFGP